MSLLDNAVLTEHTFPPNPFYCEGDELWYWYDECEEVSPYGYATEAEAAMALLNYIFWLENGLTKYAAQMAHGV